MTIRSTPHAHTTYVDGRSTAEEMVRAAIDKGFRSLGFSEHGKQSIDLTYCLNEKTEREYIDEVLRLQARYKDQIRIWLGLERDACSLANRIYYDYIIGSAHYFVRGDEWYAADGASQTVAEAKEVFFGGDGIKMARAYFKNLADYIEEMPPDIIGHFDVLTKNNEKLQLFDVESTAYRDIVYQALERIHPHCDLMEVNTGGMARGYTQAPYPALFTLKRWREMKGKVILSSDCHDARFIDYGYVTATELVRAAGFETMWALGTENALFVECEL